MEPSLVIIMILFIIWFARQYNKEANEIDSKIREDEFKRKTYDIELNYLLQLQSFTQDDALLIHLQKKTVPERLDTILSRNDIGSLRGKPVRFDNLYYEILAKLGSKAN